MNQTDEQKLPAGWSITRLGDVLEIIRGVSYRKEDARKAPSEGLVPILRANNIQDSLSFHDLVYVPTRYVSEEQMLRLSDIVVAASSGSRAIVGKAAQLKEPWHGAFGTFCFALRPERLIESRFLGWFLHTKEYRNRVSNLSAGVNINNLRVEHIEETPLRLPPFAEQERIADAVDGLLSDLDAGVAVLGRVQKKLAHYRTAILKAAADGTLTAKWRQKYPYTEPASELLARILAERRCHWEEEQLRNFEDAGKEPPKGWKAKYKEPAVPDISNLPKLPEGWIWTTVEAICSKIVDCPHSTPKWTSDGYICVRTTNFKPGFLDLSEVRYVSFVTYNQRIERLKPEPGDVLYSREGGILGIACNVPAGVELCLGQRMMLMRVSADLPSVFLMHVLNSPRTLALVKSLTAGSASPHLNVGDIKQFAVPLPPLHEQQQIVAEVEDQLSIIEHVDLDVANKLKAAQALRQSILRHAFAGQLVPQDPNDEPASELLKRIAFEREERQQQAITAKRSSVKKKQPRKLTAAI